MNLHTLWGWRKGEDGPELMVAWDAYCVDENHAGYEEAKAREIEAWGGDLYASREIIVRVDYQAVMAAFAPAGIKGVVKPVSPQPGDTE